METDLTFSTGFKVSHLRELPGADAVKPQFYYPGATQVGGRGGLVLEITPMASDPWIGVFAKGYSSSLALTGVYAYPDGRSIIAISAGQGVIVRSEDPREWREMDLFPITGVKVIQERKRLLLASFTRVAAHGPGGEIWTTERISWDGVELLDVSDDYVRGKAWDAPRDQEVDFKLHLETGEYEGGSSPENSSKS